MAEKMSDQEWSAFYRKVRISLGYPVDSTDQGVSNWMDERQRIQASELMQKKAMAALEFDARYNREAKRTAIRSFVQKAVVGFFAVVGFGFCVYSAWALIGPRLF